MKKKISFSHPINHNKFIFVACTINTHETKIASLSFIVKVIWRIICLPVAAIRSDLTSPTKYTQIEAEASVEVYLSINVRWKYVDELHAPR